MSIRPIDPQRRRLLAMTGAALAIGQAALARPPALSSGTAAVDTLTGRAFGSSWRVTLPAGSAGEDLRRDLTELLARIDRQMSPWRPDSEISGVNRAAASARISAETAHVARAALDLARQSDGWFDPSIGPLVHRWGFGPIEGDAGGWTGLRVDDHAIAKDRPGLTLDLCGIAKGRALDLMADRLRLAGHGDFLIDLGGELAARGRHPSGRPWQVAIEDPRPERRQMAAILVLDNLRVATSGTRRQGYDLGGRRYSHIIDPRRSAPVAGTLASVSVLADNAMTADGWATALTAAGPGGPALARRAGLDALFLFHEAGGLRRDVTGGFARHLL